MVGDEGAFDNGSGDGGWPEDWRTQLAAGDARLERFHEALGKPVNRLVRLGGYALPFDDAILGSPASRARGVGR